jgi:hypothetical protein
MHLTQKAKKAVAAGLALSTVMWSAAFFVALPAQAAPHSEGCIVLSGGTVWLITGGQRRGFTSAEVFASHGYNFGQVVAANSEDEALPAGPIMVYADGSIVKGPSDPLVYLVANGQKRGFVSGSVFTGLGYSFANIQWAPVNTFSDLPTGANVESSTERHPAGTWVKDGTGTVWMMTTTGRKGVPTMEVFNSYGKSWATVVAANAADLAASNEGVLTARATCSGGTMPVQGFTFSVASNTAASATVPKSATNVSFLKFNVSSSSGATVNSVTVKRTGAGASTDFDNVYLYQGAIRLTSGRSVNASTNEATFSGLSVAVPSSGSVTFDVVADMAAAAASGNVNRFEVSSVLAGATNATGSAVGNAMTISGVTAGTITIDDGSTPAAPKVGQLNAKVADFTLNASSTEDLLVKRIALFHSGTVSNNNLMNFKLMQGATTLSTASALDSNERVTFDNLSFNLDRGNTRTFEVFADIGGGARAGETVILSLDEDTDLNATGKTYGFGAAVTDNLAGATLTLEGGQLTITFNGPASKDLAKDGEDLEVFNATFAAGANIEIRQLGIDFDGGSGTANFCSAACGTQLYTDVKVWDTSSNTVVWGPQDFNDASDTTESITFTEDITMNAGQTKTFKVTLDVSNDATVADGDDIRAFLDLSELNTGNMVKNLDNNTFLDDEIVPGSDLFGNTHVVRTSALTLSLASTPTSQTYIKGTNDVPFVGFNLTASNGSPLTVNTITVTGYIDENATGGSTAGVDNSVSVQQIVPTIMLKVDGAQIGDSKSVNSTSGIATFSGLNLTIPAGTTKTVVVYGNISASAFINSNAELISFDVVNVTDIAAQDATSNTVNPGTADPNGNGTPNIGVTVANAGTLTATLAPNEVDVTDSRIVTAGMTGTTFTKVKFTAANEQMKLTKVRVNLVSSDADANIQDNIVTVQLFDGATAVSTAVSPVVDLGATATDAYADITLNADSFIVPKDGSKNLTIKVNLNTISAGADSGDEFSADLDFDTNFEARGTAGSTTLTAITSAAADVSGNDVVIRKSQPKVEFVALPDTILTNGTRVIAKFKVTAVDGDVDIKHLGFTASMSDALNTLAGLTLREVGQSNIAATNVDPSGATADPGNLDITFDAGSSQNISSGTSKTYELRATVALAAAGDTISVVMDTDTAVVTGEVDTPLAAAQQIDDIDDILNVGNDLDGDAAFEFIWSDVSAIPHSDAVDTTTDTDDAAASNDWTNGRYVDLPTDSWTQTFPS